MDGKLQAIRGMNDLLAGELPYWQRIEAAARELFADYGYREMRVPLVEHAELFKRSIGEHTDIVEKEMYSFDDRGGDRLSLRPEATAGLVRAAIEHGLLHNQKQRLWTAGPMFRHERPQAGRYRQFHQIDCEAFGYPGPDIDAEVIQVSARLWRKLGLEGLSLSVNSLGTPESRRRYRAVLVDYFEARREALDADSRRRLEANPLRILDSKNPALREWSPARRACSTTWTTSRAALRPLPRAAGGERHRGRRRSERWCGASTTTRAPSSNGAPRRSARRMPSVPAAVMMAWSSSWAASRRPRSAGPSASSASSPSCRSQASRRPRRRPRSTWSCPASGRARRPRARGAAAGRVPGRGVLANMEGGSFKAQMKSADKSGASVALIVGDDEAARGVAAVKWLRTGAAQQECGWDELPPRLAAALDTEKASGKNDGR